MIDESEQKRGRSSQELARAVDRGRSVRAALRHLDGHASDPDAVKVAEALARFLVARCDSHHDGWRVVRQVVVDSSATAPWEKCARRAVRVVAEDLLALPSEGGRMPLVRAQHIAARSTPDRVSRSLAR